MQLIIYILLYPILYLISILPFRLLYFVSDCIYVLVYYVIGYRKKTVRENLAIALPHLTAKERLAVEKKSYHHLVDTFLEMIKTMTISQKEIEKRYKFTNLDVYLDLEKKGKSIALMCGHYASYEWAVSMNFHINHKGIGIYKRIRNPYFDKLVKDIRGRFKAHLITTKETIPVIASNYRNKVMSIYGFASDQSPKLASTYHWGNFMGAEVPMHTGAEMLSKKYDMNIIFLKGKRVKRGYYEASFTGIHEDVKQYPNYQITDEFMKFLEGQILEAPEFYMWTHKRWKHQRDTPTS